MITHHSVRIAEFEFCMVTVLVSGSSVQCPPPAETNLHHGQTQNEADRCTQQIWSVDKGAQIRGRTYPVGSVLSLQNTLCILSNEFVVWPIEMEVPGCTMM